ncbi:CRISPR associated protein Cas1 [Paenibacillus sp. OK060]|nr:CRISPR associated protein Cas1 [Paenibacillus sp. OK060]
MNALLSFAFTLLANDMKSALESVGLDAHVGFLHPRSSPITRAKNLPVRVSLYNFNPRTPYRVRHLHTGELWLSLGQQGKLFNNRNMFILAK